MLHATHFTSNSQGRPGVPDIQILLEDYHPLESGNKQLLLFHICVNPLQQDLRPR